MKPILCVGMVCEDTVVKVKKFPEEDSDQRLKDITNLDFSTPDFLTILQRYAYRVLQTIEMKLILLCFLAEPDGMGTIAKTALKFKHEI